MARAKKTTKTDDRNWVEDYADGGKSIISIDQEIKESMRSYIDYALTERPILSLDSQRLDTEKFDAFLNGDYSKKYVVENISQYDINVVAQHFLDLCKESH